MNAMTGIIYIIFLFGWLIVFSFFKFYSANDYTIYPFSTTHKLDYDNLRDVYMDATFHPYLRELDFKQEGWRLEHKQPNDKSTPLQFKGVVYNEMKGVMVKRFFINFVNFIIIK